MTTTEREEEEVNDENYSENDIDNDREQQNKFCYHQCRNCQGMGGNENSAPYKPFSKIKFTISPFSGNYEDEAYLDWKMIVEKNSPLP